MASPKDQAQQPLQQKRPNSFEEISFEGFTYAQEPAIVSTLTIPNSRVSQELSSVRPSSDPHYSAIPRSDKKAYFVSEVSVTDDSSKESHSSVSGETDPRSIPHRSCIAYFGWWWELGSLLVAVICTAFIAAILFVMNGKSLESWKLPIQPNSVIAAFSAIARSALIVILANCISQLKWIHYDDRKPRKLGQMQVFDDASRGPWGAFVFLLKLRPSSMPMIAALSSILTILMLAFEPFAQQVIEFPSRDVASPYWIGSTSASFTLPQSIDEAEWLDLAEGRSLFASGMRGFLMDRPAALQNNTRCPNSDCRLPDFASLGVCSTCQKEEFDLRSNEIDCTFKAQLWENKTIAPEQEVTSGMWDYPNSWQDLRLYQAWLRNESTSSDDPPWTANRTMYSYSTECSIFRDGFDNLRLEVSGGPNGDGVDEAKIVRPGQMLYTFSDETPKDVTFTGNGWSEEHWDMGDSFGGTSKDLQGMSYCSAYPAREVDAGGKKGPDNTASEIANYACMAVHSDAWKYKDFAKVDTVKGDLQYCRLDFCAQRYEQVDILNGQLHVGSTKEIPLRVGETTANGEMTLVADELPDHDFKISLSARDRLFEIINLSGWYDVYGTGALYSDWPKLYNAVAATVTNTFIQGRQNPDHYEVQGPAWVKETYVRVRWAWFFMPLGLVACSALVLLLTALDSARRPYLYKSSIIAPLLRGVENENGQDYIRPSSSGMRGIRETRWDLMKVADTVEVRLGRSAEGGIKFLKVD